MADLKVKVNTEGLDQVVIALGGLFTPQMKTDMVKAVGINAREHLSDHLARASVSRHKSADRLGAPHTGFLEFANTRGMTGGSGYKGKGPKPYTAVENISEGGVDIVVGNTPGLSRAFGPLTIRAKDKLLTIPINKESYSKSCAELRSEGWKLFQPTRRGWNSKMGVIFGTRKTEKEKTGEYNLPNGGKAKAKYKKTESETVPLFVLKGQVTIPQDRGLLPEEYEFEEWAEDSIESFMEGLLK